MNEYSIALAISLSVVLFFGITYLIKIYRLKSKSQESISIVRSCSAMERRKTLRNILHCKALVHKHMPEGSREFEEFEIRDISSGGIYLYTDQDVEFSLGDEVDLVVELDKSKYYNGRGRVVHSQAVFDEQSVITESGIGIRFLSPPNSFAMTK